jgi:hypothetical protein
MKTKSILTLLCACGASLLAVVNAFGLGSDHPTNNLSEPAWPEGMAGLVNVTNRVHGFWVNSEDVFFFSGSTADFTAFLAQYSKMQGIKEHLLILDDGAGEAKSPWANSGPACDWELYGSSRWVPKDTDYVLEVHFWTGGKIPVDSLTIPDQVKVTGSCLKNFEAITNGMTRAEVEKRLTMDGGLQGVSPVRFVDPGCPGFKINVEFDFKQNAADRNRAVRANDDQVIRVSKPYPEPPFVD